MNERVFGAYAAHRARVDAEDPGIGHVTPLWRVRVLHSCPTL
jgi:hypothetical protein